MALQAKLDNFKLANSIATYGLNPKDWSVSQVRVKNKNIVQVEFTHKKDSWFKFKGLVENLQGTAILKQMRLVSV